MSILVSPAADAGLLPATHRQFIDGLTGNVTSFDGGYEMLISCHPSDWALFGASSTLISRVAGPSGGVLGDARALNIQFRAGSCSPGDRYKGDTPETAGLSNQARPAGGVHFMRPLRRCSRAVMLYGVRFPVGFDWRGGGKLPGLSSRLWDASGGNTAVGGITSFTARQMWRPNGQFTPYYYMGDNASARWVDSHYSNPSMPAVNWGSAAFSGSTIFCDAAFFRPGQWDVIRQEIWLNDPGKSNGGARLSLNGVDLADRGDLIWRHNNDLWIDAVFFSTFFGGNTFSEGDASIWFTPTSQLLGMTDTLIAFLE